MGRGLSPLQRSLLTLAYRNRQQAQEYIGHVVRVEVKRRAMPPADELRRLVPEAFVGYPDGYWREPPWPTLIVSSFPRPMLKDHDAWVAPLDRAKAVVHLLKARGLDAVCESYNTGDNLDLFTAEAYYHLYGLTDRHPKNYSPGRIPPRPPEGFPDAIYARDHLRHVVGHGATNTQRVDISRAFDRLAERGFVTRHSMALHLTDAGRALASGLSANQDDNRTLISRYEWGGEEFEALVARLAEESAQRVAAAMERFYGQSAEHEAQVAAELAAADQATAGEAG